MLLFHHYKDIGVAFVNNGEISKVNITISPKQIVSHKQHLQLFWLFYPHYDLNIDIPSSRNLPLLLYKKRSC